MDQRPLTPVPAANPWKPIAGLVVVLFVATLIGGWLYVESVRNDFEMRLEALKPPPAGTPAVQPQPAPTPAPVVADLVFDPSTVAVGDAIGQWTVSRVEKDESENPLRVYLEGTTTVSGTYTTHSDDEPFFSGLVTFRTDSAAAAVIPRVSTWNGTDPSGSKYRFFAFEDDAAARQAFGAPGSTGRATVMVREYVVNANLESEAFDTAEFVRITGR